MKPGLSTTELWFGALASVFTAAQPFIDQYANADWKAALPAALAAIYTGGRTYLKGKESSKGEAQ